MSTLEAIESIQAAMEPLEALQGEHTQLEAWVHDSFGALEKLHGDLSDWQTELARKQTELDLREDELEKCQGNTEGLDKLSLQWKKDLELAREEVLQLEDENAEQLLELEKLERSHLQLEAELEAARERTQKLADALEAERARTAEDQHRWEGEFQQLREMLAEQHQLLSQHFGTDHHEPPLPASSHEIEITSRTAELKRRAQSRRAAKRRQQRNTQDSDDL